MMDLLPPAPLSVTALNALAKNLLETDLAGLWVTGEISNLTRAASGHYYFALKDDRAQVRCALFKGNVRDCLPKEGDEVEISGRITLYEARGEFQIVVQEIRQTGAGRLFAAYEALKNRLFAEGLFAPERKQALPFFPHRVGIVTSPAAAALRDVATTLRRRMSSISVIVYPTAVQGKGSEQEIADAVHLAGKRNEVDVLIVCRGGGSIEDLWAFNEEVVVRTIATCPLPVVCGVGHETDFTLSDFAADVRAPTPTAAAELVSPDRSEWTARIGQLSLQAAQMLRRKYFDACQHTDRLERLLRHPREKLPLQRKALADAEQRMHLAFSRKYTTARLHFSHLDTLLNNARPDTVPAYCRLQAAETRLIESKDLLLSKRNRTVEQLAQLLDAISPHNIMRRGFSIVTDRRGNIVSDSHKLRLGQNLHIRFADGETDVAVIRENQQKDLFD